jgi:hypothetical protein
MAALTSAALSGVATKVDCFTGTRSWKIEFITSSYVGEAAFDDRAEMVLPNNAEFLLLGRTKPVLVPARDVDLAFDEMVEPNKDDLGAAAEVADLSGTAVEVKSSQMSWAILAVVLVGTELAVDGPGTIPDTSPRIEFEVEIGDDQNACRASVMIANISLE